MIKAVVFDCFGVLTTDGWLPMRQRYFGDDADKFEQAGVLNRQVDGGVLSYEQFLAGVAEMAGIGAEQVRREIESNVANQPLFEYIRDKIRPNYATGFLSNAGANWLDRLFEPWQVALFDEVVLSCDLGVIKPHPLMYQTIANKLGFLPEECVFVDDQPRYCEGARSIGMSAIHYQNLEQCVEDLERVLSA